MIKLIVLILSIQFYYSQDKGLSLFEKKDYKQSLEYYLNVLNIRENDISAKFGAGISAFKNQDIETGMKFLQEVSNSKDEILSSRAHFNLANIGDTRSWFLHPGSTTHRQLTEEQREGAGASSDAIRLSVGIEDVDDIISDVEQALKQV